MSSLPGHEPDYEGAVIGAGFSGIGAGIRLRDAGIHSFVILEQAADLGGTWRDDTYPGVAVDTTTATRPNGRSAVRYDIDHTHAAWFALF